VLPIFELQTIILSVALKNRYGHGRSGRSVFYGPTVLLAKFNTCQICCMPITVILEINTVILLMRTLQVICGRI